jgi:hypothetical protein
MLAGKPTILYAATEAHVAEVAELVHSGYVSVRWTAP